MKLRECKLGEVVATSADEGDVLIGHIVGLRSNHMHLAAEQRKDISSVVPLVQFASEAEPRLIHHSNLEIYKGEL